MNRNSENWNLRDVSFSMFSLTNKKTGETKTVGGIAPKWKGFPSSTTIALMSEAAFDKLCNEAFGK